MLKRLREPKAHQSMFSYLALGTVAELLLDGGGGLEVVGLLVQLHDVQLQQLLPGHLPAAAAHSFLSALTWRSVAPAVVVEEAVAQFNRQFRPWHSFSKSVQAFLELS